ncbi:MAG: FecR domain-containing protein, partial [Sphingomonadales bacterium]
GIAPRPLVIGTNLKEGAIVRTASNAFLTVRFADGSRISLPSNTVVRIVAARHVALGDADDRRLAVENGRSTFEVTPATRAGSRFEVRTPMAVAAVRGTEFRVGYRPDIGSSILEVLDGQVAESGTTNEESAAVDAGMAALRTQAGAARQLLPLPPAPDLDDPGKTQSEVATVFRIAAPLPANSYRFQLARDAGFVDSFAETTVADGNGAFANVPNGTFFVRATGIDANGIEGRPVVYSFDRQRSSLEASAESPSTKGSKQFTFKWSGTGEGRFVYRFVLARDPALADAIVDQAGLSGNAITLTDLAPGTYYWQVSFVQSVGTKTYTRSLKVNELRIAATH